MPSSLLTPDLIRRLDRLKIETRRVLGGQLKGERRSRRKGIGMDFADTRQYSRGDDLRYVDWNIYGRLDRLFIKIFHEEQDLVCHLLLDVSRSMDYGDPSKFDFARRLAASIGYIGLKGQDKFSLSCFNAATASGFGPARGRHNIRRLFQSLQTMEPTGTTSLATACHELAQRIKSKAVVIVISDLLDPAGFETGLRSLARETLDVYVIHVLAPEEIDSTLGGHLELHDMETGHKVEVTVNARLKQQYQRTVEAFCGAAREFCTRRGFYYALVRTDMPLEDLILRRLREGGLVKA